MAAIYLRHKFHGTKVAIAEAEAVADEKNGWERYHVPALFISEEKLPIQTITGDEIESEELTELRQQWEVKYGKPPHHRKGIQTLRAEL